MDEKYREFLSAWTLADWRQYVATAFSVASGIYERELTVDERKRLRRRIFETFRKGTASSSRTAGILFTVPHLQELYK